MKLKFTFLFKHAKFTFCLLSFILITQLSNFLYAQTKNYATVGTEISNQVDNPTNAQGNNNSFATVKSYGGLLLGAGKYSGELELKFPGNIPANTTTYIRVDFDATLLKALLGGNLGSALASTVGGLVLGDHSITIGARNSGGSLVASGSSSGGFSTTGVRLVKDQSGLTYLAITPTGIYDRVFVKDVTSALLLGDTNNTKVYNAFYTSGSGGCDPATYTDYDGTGLTASVLGIGKAGVTDLEKAIDNNNTTFSQVSLGALGVAGTISQNIYFDALSNVGDEANVKLSVSSAFLNVGLLNNITINLYNGNNPTPVGTFNDFNILGLDLLGLLTSGQPVNVNIPASAPFNRVTVTLSSLLNVNVTQTVNIYGVTRSAAKPTLNSPQVATCYNSTVSLTANTATTNQLLWYDALEGGTLLATKAYNESYTTAALTANKTYYVAAKRIGCTEESTRAAVTVILNPRPVLPQLQASASTVTAGQTVKLTATSTDTDVDFLWYTSANGLVPVYTGSTYTTPPLNTTTTYFVEAKSKSNTCGASSRASITVNVNNGGAPNPVPCEAANGEVNGVDGVAILADVVNPALAIDDNTETGSTLLMPVGALSASVYQRLSFASLSNVRDTVKVLISSPGKLLSLSLLSNVKLTTYNGSTSNNDAVSLNNALINIELLSGNTQALLTFVPTSIFNAVEIRLNSGLVGALSSLNINYAQHIIAAPEVTSANVSVCLSQTASLSVKNPKANLTYKWFDAAGIYQTGKDGTTFVTPVLTANTKYFVAASSSTGCISYKTALNVTINGAPVTPVFVSAIITTCSGTDVVLQIKNPIVGSIYKWYNAANIYQSGKDGVSFSLIGVTTNTTYSVEAVNSCGAISSRATATINVGVLDAPIVTPPAVSISSGAVAVLTASSSTANATFNWYTTETSPTILYTGSIFVTPKLTQTTTYYVSAFVNGSCISARTPVIVTVVPDGTPELTPCGTASIAIADGVNGVALLSGVFNAGLAVDNKVETASSLVINVGALGAYVYQRVGFTGGLSNVGDTLRIRLTSPGKLLSVAALQNIGVTTFKGSVSNNDLTIVSNPLISIDLLSDNSAVILTFVPTAQFDGLELRLNSGLAGALTSVNFNYANRIVFSPKVNVTSASTCQGSAAILNVVNPINGVIYKWYLEKIYQTGKDGVTFTTPTTLAAGTYNYFVTATSNGCESYPTKVVVTILALPATPVPVTGNPTTTCFGTSVTLAVQQVSGITYKWYNAAGDVLVINNNSYSTPANLPVGSYDFFIEATNVNSCTSSTRAKITISVGSLATAADIQVSGVSTLCGPGTVTLTANTTTVTNPIFTWYSDANLTTVIFTGSVFTSPVLTTNTIYYITVKGSNKCENKPADAKVVTVMFNTTGTAADITVKGNTTTCINNSSVLTASSTTVTNPIFTWYSDANLTTVVYTGATFTTPNLTSNTTYYVTVKGDNRCENKPADAKSITITISTAPVLPIVSSVGTLVCAGSSTTLSIQNEQTGVTYQWFVDATTSTVLFTGATFTTSVLNTTTTYYVSALGNTGCNGTTARVKVIVTVTTPPSLPTVMANVINGCIGSTALITIANPVTGVTYTYYSTATGGTALGNGNSFTTPIITTNAVYYVEASYLGSCASNGRTQVNIIANAIPTAPTSITASNPQLCGGSSVTLTVNNPDANLNYRWYATSSGGTALFEGNSYTTVALSATTIFYVESASKNGGCSSGTRTAVTVTVNPILATPVVKVEKVTSTSILFIWNAITGATNYEISVNGGSSWLQVASNSYLVDGLQAGKTVTIIVRAKGQIGCQTSANSTPVTGRTDDPLGNEVYIPNTFTPNGDGKNDIFLAYGNSVTRFNMSIYNQWGQFIMESQSITKGWDGNFKGKIQPNGVYVYQMEVTFADGTAKKFKGTITLLR